MTIELALLAASVILGILHIIAPAELATRLLVDCQLAGTERCAAHRHCRKG
jgi:hypothetical protein